MEAQDGVVIPFPTKAVAPKLCMDCQESALHVSGIYCVELQEFIWNESTANDCELFTPIQEEM